MSFDIEKYLDECGCDKKYPIKSISKRATKKMIKYEMDMSSEDNNGATIKIGQKNKGADGVVESKPKGPKGKCLPNPGDKKSVKFEGELEMNVVEKYLQDAVGGDADQIEAADKAKVAKGKNDASGKGNTAKSYVSSKTGEAIEPNSQKKVASGPKLGSGANKKGGNANSARGGY